MASQYEKDKQARKEAIMAQKQKAKPITPSVEKKEVLKPKTAKEKWQNYWYHYKIPTFLGAIVLIFAVSLLWNMLSKSSFDATFTIVTERQYEGSESFLEEKLTSLVDDVDGNGKKQIRVETYMITVGDSKGASTELIQMNRAKLIAKLNKNDSFLYMVDSAVYEDMKDLGVVFKELSEISNSSRIDGERYSLKDSNFAKKIEMSEHLDDIYLCIIDFDQFEAKEQQSLKHLYEKDKALLEKIIQYN